MFAAILLGVFLSLPCQSHQIDEISGSLETSESSLQIRLLVDAAYALPESRGDENPEVPDLAWLRSQTPEAWERIRDEATHYLQECLRGDADGKPIQWEVTFPDFATDPPRFVSEGDPEMPPMLEVVAETPLPQERLVLSWTEPLGVVLILTTSDEILPVVSGDRITIFEHEGGRPSKLHRPGFIRWLQIGWEHILPHGTDHILFILGVYLLLPQWKSLLKQSLTFTLAHSATLIFAALGWVNLPTTPIEVLIALSISWMAWENLRRTPLDARRYATIAGFGLIHGLGFAKMLQPLLPPGRPDQWAIGIVGFNLGVEAGQIAVLVVAWSLSSWWQPAAFQKLRFTGSLMIAAVGLYWAFERGISAFL
ncbi:HupE/UreJ family protein [Haloferula luteola]|nr:HupE/UreJ family protein [Haloferula luteola]